jgi:phosphatidylglycerophosphate synthase
VPDARSRPEPVAVPEFSDYLIRWSGLHGGYEPSRSRFVRGWLLTCYTLARPLARWRVSADVVTLVGLLVTGLAVAAAAAGGRWPVAGAVVILASGILDSVDGAVAVLSDTTSRWGHVLDSAADRCGDAVYLLALGLLGAPVGVCVAAGAVTTLAEYVRARAGAAGMDEIGVVSVNERPTRVAVTAVALAAASVLPGHAGVVGTVAAAVWLTTGVVGLGQILRAVRVALR